MTGLISRMDRWLGAGRPGYHARLRPGVSDGRPDEFEARFGLTLPAAFRLPYGWRGGQKTACPASLQNDVLFSPLAGIVDSKGLRDGMIGSDFEDPRWRRRGWVPLLGNGGGGPLCLDLAAEGGGTPCPVITFCHDDPRRPVRFPSLGAWLEDLVVSMEDGTLRVT